MTTARQHYEQLLGPVYRWSVSIHGDPYARAYAQLDALEVLDARSYLDLGAGFGAHVVPLARAGKEVTAVDFEPQLLEQLADAATLEDLPIEWSASDLLNFLERASDRLWDVVLCLGDTLTHLESLEDVRRFLGLVARRLQPSGRLVLGYRDSTRVPTAGVDRFVFVGRDVARSMHCLLEPLDAQHLRVTDIVTDLEADGPHTKMSDYVKLRIARDELVAWATSVGLVHERQRVERGMTELVFRLAQAPAIDCATVRRPAR